MNATPKKLTPWLQQHLIQQGAMDAAYVTRTAKARRCPLCQAPTLAVIPAERSEAHYLDPHPTTSFGELTALMAGRATWDIHSPKEVEQRFAWDIQTISADAYPTVHAEHQCNSLPLPVHPNKKRTDMVDTYPQNPPF